MVNQYEIYWVSLDPTIGTEVKKTRPCVVITPDEMNHNLGTVMIAPLTSTTKLYPSRILCNVQGKKGTIMLDQIRTVDKKRLIKKIAQLSAKEIKEVKEKIKEMLVD